MEFSEKKVKNEDDICVNNLEDDSAKLESDKISETEAATKNVELEMEESKGSPKHGRVEDEEDKNSDVEECDSVNVSREAEDAVQALQEAEQGDSEGKENSPDSCEQERDHLTPELSVSGPSPISQPCVTDCISDTNSDVPAPLTPQVPTPPPVRESLSPHFTSVDVPSVSQSDMPAVSETSQVKSGDIDKSNDKNFDKANSQTVDDEDSTSDDDIPSDDNYQDDFNESPPGAPAPVVSLQPPPPQPSMQPSPIQPSPVQPSSVQPSPMQQSPLQPSPVQQSPVQQSPIQHSPIQPSPIQQSPVQQSPVSAPAVQKQPESAKSFHETSFTEELQTNFEQLSNSSTNNLQNESLPQQDSLKLNHSVSRPPQNQSLSNNFPPQVFQPNSTMGPMTNTNIGNNGYGNEMDVTQLPGLESPASISSNDMPNSNNSGETVAPQILGFMDCAEAQSQRTYINNMNSRNSGRYMDMVSSSYPVVSSCGSFISPVPTGTNIVQNFCPPPVSTYALQQQQQQQQNSTHRLTHSNSQCRVQQPPSVSHQNSGPGPYPPQNISCNLAKLQQLTNGLPDLMPESTMTPPPNLTPPPHNMTPPPMMRGMATPPIPNQQNSSGLMGQQYKQYQQQQRQRQSSVRKSPNVTVNPNMPFTPNVTIRPGSNMITGYNNLLDSYRMRQPMLNPGYINHGFPLNQLGQTPQIPMQMLNMNMNMNMNMNPAQQHFQQHMQPSQSNNMYAYGYINGSLPPSLNNMNGMMRR